MKYINIIHNIPSFQNVSYFFYFFRNECSGFGFFVYIFTTHLFVAIFQMNFENVRFVQSLSKTKNRSEKKYREIYLNVRIGDKNLPPEVAQTTPFDALKKNEFWCILQWLFLQFSRFSDTSTSYERNNTGNIKIVKKNVVKMQFFECCVFRAPWFFKYDF